MRDDLSFDDPCLLFALRREAQAFLREFPVQQRFPGAPGRARFCGPTWLMVLVMETGVGAAAAQKALDWATASPLLGRVPYRPKLVLSAGFAGALADGYQVGDILLADEVVDAEGNCWPVTWPTELPPGEWRPPLHRGRLLASPVLVGDPTAKRELGQKHGAVAVDMESATIARHCTRKGIPFGCVRAVSDDVDTPLSPQLVTILQGGRVSPLAVLGAMLRRPGLTGELWRLARQTSFAGALLGKALGELLTLTLPWMADEK